MMELTIHKIREIQLDILKSFDEFCRENNIRYLLCNGTLLGAVKYKGYIPWDDDIDVCMLREEYDKLVSVFNEKNKNEKLTLRAFESDQSYLFPFAKLSDNTTSLIENGVADIGLGVNIDIFPIDNYGQTKEACKKRFERFSLLRKKLNRAKLTCRGSKTVIKTVAKAFIAFPYKLVGAKYYCRRIIKEAIDLDVSGRYRGNVVWGFYGDTEAFSKELFESFVEVEFEGGKYYAPEDYDTYLTGLYGEWRKDPPKEKQKTHHSYKAYLK